MSQSTKVITLLTIQAFKELIKRKKCVVGAHALDRLDDLQRKVYDKNLLLQALEKEKPKLIGRQANGRMAVYFERKGEYLRIIIEEKPDKYEIVTFTNSLNLPNLRGINHEK